MKIDALKEFIVKTIKQEIKNSIREEIKGYLNEVFSNKNEFISEIQNDSTVKLSSEQVQPNKPKKYVKYTSNETLNKILNETTGGVPQESGFVGMLGGGFESKTEQLNEVKVPDNAPAPVKNVVNAINRDYRSLLKAVENRKSNKIN